MISRFMISRPCSRHYVGRGYVGDLLDESQEIHPWHQDGLRWTQEEEGTRTAHRLFEGFHEVKD